MGILQITIEKNAFSGMRVQALGYNRQQRHQQKKFSL